MFWWTVLIISLISSVESHGGHGYGSHSHMPKHNKHEHYKPVLPEADEANNKVPAYALLKDKKLLQDAEHIREDLADTMPGVDLSKMGEEELEFHYFKLHDYDGNNKLDGLEIMSAITHILPSIESELGDETEQADPKAYRRRRLAAQERRLREINYQFAPMIDRLLQDDDQDNDGYLNYAEFSLSKRNGARVQT